MLVVLLLLLLPQLVELGAEGVYLGRELLSLFALLLLHPLEFLLEVAVGIAHTLPQVVLGLSEVFHLPPLSQPKEEECDAPCAKGEAGDEVEED